MARQVKASVISGDIVGSSRLRKNRRAKLQVLLDDFFKQAKKQWPDWRAEQYRGDSLQVVLTTSRENALRIALLLHTKLAAQKFYIRLAIGTGTVSFGGNDVITSDGTAFQASGLRLDAMKKNGEIIGVAGNDESFTREWNVHSASLNFILRRVSVPQAEAVHLQLQNRTQTAIAKQLKIRQPSVNQRLQIAGGHVLQAIVRRFEDVAQHS